MKAELVSKGPKKYAFFLYINLNIVQILSVICSLYLIFNFYLTYYLGLFT